MENYSFNKFIAELDKKICNMEMPGFDQSNDSFLSGNIAFEVDYEDCTGVVVGTVTKTFNGDSESRIIEIESAFLQFVEDKIPFNIEDRNLIEKELKL